MSEVVDIRKNQPFKKGDLVRLGTADHIFEVVRLGFCGPQADDGGTLVNGHEFVQLGVPGHGDAVINVHARFLQKV